LRPTISRSHSQMRNHTLHTLREAEFEALDQLDEAF
jgi:hypothetical protein